ncbi:hypothetical protein GUITHDRAFT_147619 [Guillardia theta CCMP2712]|uniref:Uncharacterized protein n=1 Tax=Guillardia theta (strain CCMP2712) TaxID=905079 RepID=L1IDE4_GUITC|nr:hypothetical protein GUITHDRAFT_147619 [Guillardia theta CCMP2712]EKX33835.1 hypothetical protein GUITHDRAFT_147619 [Guillardia theta CCMP2712]|eukprot:XP_005820815.1 hypothetical protein GUITHDRAFT_147619 [Guillardia theta CCMP2712]
MSLRATTVRPRPRNNAPRNPLLPVNLDTNAVTSLFHLRQDNAARILNGPQPEASSSSVSSSSAPGSSRLPLASLSPSSSPSASWQVPSPSLSSQTPRESGEKINEDWLAWYLKTDWLEENVDYPILQIAPAAPRIRGGGTEEDEEGQKGGEGKEGLSGGSEGWGVLDDRMFT